MSYKFLLIFLFVISVFLSADSFFSINDLQKFILPATILLVSAIFALSWALSDLFNSPELKAWVKIELRSFISGAILMILVLALFFGTNSVTYILTGQPDVSGAAINTLEGFTKPLEAAYSELVTASHYIGMAAGFGYSAPAWMYYFSYSFMNSPHSGVSALNSMVMQGATSISQGIFIYYTLIVLLDYFSKVIPPVILPIALSLRFIPFTKKIGNTLIALCIGAAIIFPVSVLLVSEFHNIAMKNIGTPTLDMEPFKSFSYPAIGWLCGGGDAVIGTAKAFIQVGEFVWGIIAGVACCAAFPPSCPINFVLCFTAASSVVYPITVGAYQALFWTIVAMDYNSFFGEVDVIGIYYSLSAFLETVIKYLLISVIDALLIIIITVVGTKSISMAIGGEGYFYGIQRLIG